MDNNYQESVGIFDFGFDESTKETLKSIAKWAKIVAITAFVSYGISLIGTFIGKSAAFGANSVISGASATLYLVFLIIAIGIGVLLNYFLFSFSKQIVEAVDTNSEPQLDSSFGNLRYYFLIIGVFVILILVFFVLAFLLAIVAGAGLVR